MNVGVNIVLKGAHNFTVEGETHYKSLPYISIVNAITGSYEVSINGGPMLKVSEGDCFFTPANSHQMIIHHPPIGKTPMSAQWIFMDIRVNGAYYFQQFYEIPTLIPRPFSSQLCEYIKSYCETDEKGIFEDVHRKKIIYSIVELLIELSTPLQKKINERLLPAFNLINEELTRNISVLELSQACSMSQSHFFRIFSQSTDVSPLQYIKQQRLSKASELLVATDKSVHDIASILGFYDQFYFCREFKKEYRITPTQYRRLHNNAVVMI